MGVLLAFIPPAVTERLGYSLGLRYSLRSHLNLTISPRETLTGGKLPLCEKPVRQLMHDFVADLGIRPGQTIDRDQVLDWFRTSYPPVKEGTRSNFGLELRPGMPELCLTDEI